MWAARIRDGIFLELSNKLCGNLPGILLGCKAVAICFASFFQIVCRVPMFLSSRKRSYFLYIQNLNAPARARVRDPSARFMSHKSPGKQGVDVAGAAQRGANQDTQHHHVAAIKDCISHITSFCSGGKHLVLHENQTACFIESGATAMLWCFMVCLHVFPCGKKLDLVYLSTFTFIYCPSNVQGTFHQPPCFTAPPWRTTSRWLWRRSFQPPVRCPREQCWRTSGTYQNPWPKPLQILGLESCGNIPNLCTKPWNKWNPSQEQEPSKIHPIQKANLPEPARNSAVPKP